jgi:hypothetical protein
VVISDHASALDEIALEGERSRRCSRRDAQLGEDVLQVAGDGVLADHECHADLPVAPAGRNEAQHLEFTVGEPVSVNGRGAWQERPDAGEVRCSSQLREDVASRFQLKRSRVRVAERPAGKPHEDPETSALVQRLELLPQLPGAAERDQRRLRVALGEEQRSEGVC